MPAEMPGKHLGMEIGMGLQDFQHGRLEGSPGCCFPEGEDRPEGDMEQLATFVLIQKYRLHPVARRGHQSRDGGVAPKTLYTL